MRLCDVLYANGKHLAKDVVEIPESWERVKAGFALNGTDEE